MMPLWTTATRGVACGCALTVVGAPCVAPAGMADADHAVERVALEQRFEVGDFALAAAPFDMAVDDGRNASRIIAAVFEPLEAVDQERCRGLRTDHTENATHAGSVLSRLVSGRRLGLMDALGPAFAGLLGRARQGQRIARHVARDHAAGADDGAVGRS